MNGWLKLDTCPDCGGGLSQYDMAYTAPYFEVEFCNGRLPMVTVSNFKSCDACGLVVQSPRMTDERIIYYYSSGLYRDTLTLTSADMDADEQRRASDVADWLRQQSVKPKRHLDIGCSRGYLLESVGASVQHGYDNNPSYSGHIRVYGDKSKLQQYDLVTAVHVLEHTINPAQEIEWYKSLTTDLLLIEVPGENCKGGPLRFAHLYYFPPETLVDMLIWAGLRVMAMERDPNTRILCKRI